LQMRSVRQSEPVFDLARIRSRRDIGDRRVLGLTGTMRDHRGVAGLLGHLDGVERLGERTDLVDLDENRVGHALFDALPKETRRW